MVRVFQKNYTRREINKYFGSLKQFAGIQPFKYQEGRAGGLSAAEVRSGGGLRFIVLLDRAMDIGLCDYKGFPISFRSAVGESSPCFFNSNGDEWLRNFGGGLLTTCGLTHLGSPCNDLGEDLGLHGNISNIPAESISYQEDWQGDECIIICKGKVREARTLSTNIVLEREIKTIVGDKRLFIKDIIRNEGYKSYPHMILYHINLGHPLLDEGSRLLVDSKEIIPRDKIAEEYLKNYDLYSKPIVDYPDIVFYHNLKREDGWSKATIYNERLKLGFYVKYQADNLPNFVQWKYTGAGNYVTGLEPANCRVEGRDKERENGTLIYLEPGQEVEYNLELGIIEDIDI